MLFKGRATGICLSLIGQVGPGNGYAAILTLYRRTRHDVLVAKSANRSCSLPTLRAPILCDGVFILVDVEATPDGPLHVVWSALVDPSVVSCSAEPIASTSPDAFCLARLAIPATTIVSASGVEHVSISDGLRRIRLDVRTGTLFDGPVRLHYRLAGFADAEPHLLTLQQLIALHRHGRFARGLHPRETKAERWVMMLRAHDLSAYGASQREIAGELFGCAAASTEWRARSDFLRLRIQRLLRDANAMISGGYLDLLRGSTGKTSDGSRLGATALYDAGPLMRPGPAGDDRMA
jgi:hypothetical protein